jgi:hypothetical protein
MLKEKHMRSIALLGLIATAASLAGCQINPYGDESQNQRFTTWSDVNFLPRVVRFPMVATFPDETMFFYPIWETQPRSDLKLRAISCARADNGTLVISARVQNLGADVIPNTALLTGDFAAFRVAAIVTTADGGRESVSAAQVVPLTVTSTVSLALNATRALADDVTRIDVVADPDRVVPDPVRDNNSLSWQGRIDPTHAPQCNVER